MNSLSPASSTKSAYRSFQSSTSTIGKSIYQSTSFQFLPSTRRSFHNSKQPYTGPSFCFDIDGVLKQGEYVLPEAKEALQILSGKNKFGRSYPFILNTNGGGTLESQRVNKLSNELGVTIGEHQFMQSHTPFKNLASQFANLPILVIGGQDDNCRKVATNYGFNDVYIPADILNWFPSIWPFDTLTDKEKGYVRKQDFSKVKFAAVFVFHDSRDWGRDCQLIIDLVRSENGIIGTCASDSTSTQIPIFFSAEDLLWGNDFPQVRFGAGAFEKSLVCVYKAMTGKELQRTVGGKPHKVTYDYASSLLKNLINSKSEFTNSNIGNVYMVGDNPKSDIAGANAYGWQSILVRTGVFRGEKLNDDENPAHFVADNVLTAVKWALEKDNQVI